MYVLAERYGLLVTWIALILFFAVLMPTTFATWANASYIASSQATLLIVAIGVTAVMAAGDFDLSSIGTVTISVVLVGYLNVVHGWPILPTVLVAIGVSLFIGLVNAFVVVRIGIDSLIVTLAMGSVLTGAALGVNNLTVSGVSDTLVNIARSTIADTQLVFFYAIGLAVVAWYVFQHTALGQRLFFTGAGREVARLSGVRVDAVRAGALILSSVCSGVAGVLLAGVLGSADPNAGVGYGLAPFAAAMLGSTSFVPGRFNVLGTTVATYFLATGIVGLQLLGTAGWFSQVFYGLALIVGVGLSTIGTRRSLTTGST